jgi:hypothetical protein
MTANPSALTRSEEIIMEMMTDLSEDDPRYQVLEAALAFKASWIILAEHLNKVFINKMHLAWGYKSFGAYCTDEIRITSATAKKMVRSYQWLDEEAPDLVPRENNGRIRPNRAVPDFRTVGILADARKALDAEHVNKRAYDALKEAALSGSLGPTELRRELKAQLPAPPAPTLYKRERHLRRALTTAVKTLEFLREWDGSDDLIIRAEDLRNHIAQSIPKESQAASQPA